MAFRFPRWSSLPLRVKGLVVVALPILPLVCFWSVVGIALVRRPAPSNTGVRSLQVQAQLARVFSALLDADAGVRDYLLTDNRAALARYQQAIDRVKPTLASLDRSVIDSSLRSFLTTLAETADDELLVLGRLAGDRSPAVPKVGERASLDRSAANLERARGLMATIEQRQIALSAQRTAQTLAAQRWLFMWLLIGSVVCAAAGVIASLVLAAGISRRRGVLARNAERLARGEEPEPLPGGEDEIAHLDARFREAARQLRVRDGEVRARTTALEAANRELESFSYSVSHDLRAPLRAIAGFSQALEEDAGGRLDDANRDSLRRVREAAARMSHIIDDLLKLSRLSQMELRREPVDLSAEAVAVAADLATHGPARQVDVAIAPDLAVVADRRMVRIVLENLLENAWKYTARKPRARIEVGGAINGGPAVFHVKDNGAGFDMQYADRLFGAFQRLHNEREFPGFGIGLATVQRVVNRHGGRIWAEATVDSGASFYFTLEPETRVTT